MVRDCKITLEMKIKVFKIISFLGLCLHIYIISVTHVSNTTHTISKRLIQLHRLQERPCMLLKGEGNVMKQVHCRKLIGVAVSHDVQE